MTLPMTRVLRLFCKGPVRLFSSFRQQLDLVILSGLDLAMAARRAHARAHARPRARMQSGARTL
eukprot:CAMPEP_0204226280 /NCGR_PEP_ID=MMETSP0361-20130328/84821_1 /ASSEMBLY_ACC=CAM_ASM_000343 /TAXON_ID=268821 /ORGANISM="Scrippsiella Hangoei, Strain SHTV-5" /LENGTH=63 /DNA_ID=CAMNT_0051193145 /DNA_START=265 /DNA_END=453 /DNA_ORIENTATION=-